MASRAKILLVSGSHLCHNPRVFKEATALADAGYEVEVLGAWYDPTLKRRDLDLIKGIPFGFVPVLDLVSSGKVVRNYYRLRTKLGRIMHRGLGWQNKLQLGNVGPELRRLVARRNADLVIAHSEMGLAALSLPYQGRIGVDMEDWFSEDLLPEARHHRPLRLLRELERGGLRSATYSACPSRVMSEALAREYACALPTVLYNAFPWADRKELDGTIKDRRECGVPSVHWYSQTLGPGRGLEDLFAALQHMKHTCEVHLRGIPLAGFNEWLTFAVPAQWRSRVYVHGLVSNEELLSRIAEHDIGLAGEMKHCRSRNLTVTNKILHYLLAGLAVVASDTAGQREVAAQAPKAIRLYPSGNARALAEELDTLLSSGSELRTARTAALAAAERTFCWERQAPTLLSSIETALA